jgi:hypothetical protein
MAAEVETQIREIVSKAVDRAFGERADSAIASMKLESLNRAAAPTSGTGGATPEEQSASLDDIRPGMSAEEYSRVAGRILEVLD